MTYAEYYARTASIGGFIKPVDFSEAFKLNEIYNSDALIQATHLSNVTNSKIIAIAAGLEIDTSKELLPSSFLSQFGLGFILRRALEGFNEVESETKKGDNTSVQEAEASTFKSFPQVTALELYNENKIGKNSSNGSINDIIDEQRNLKREYNSKDNTEYLAHMLSDTLELIANEYVKLTALDGIYFRPDSL